MDILGTIKEIRPIDYYNISGTDKKGRHRLITVDAQDGYDSVIQVDLVGPLCDMALEKGDVIGLRTYIQPLSHKAECGMNSIGAVFIHKYDRNILKNN